jgi:hypothetical protein
MSGGGMGSSTPSSGFGSGGFGSGGFGGFRPFGSDRDQGGGGDGNR